MTPEEVFNQELTVEEKLLVRNTEHMTLGMEVEDLRERVFILRHTIPSWSTKWGDPPFFEDKEHLYRIVKALKFILRDPEKNE